jgi:hypothetical protein
MEAQLQEIINKLDHLIALNIEQLMISRHGMGLTDVPPTNGRDAAVAGELAAAATADLPSANEVSMHD